MRENTPPRAKDIEEEDDLEVIHFEHDEPPHDEDFDDIDDDDDDEELVETTVEQLEELLGSYMPRKDDALLTFHEHGKPVFACDIHPQHDWAVTGGQDDNVYIWRMDSGDVMHKISQHKDTVTVVRFNHDGTYLVSGDMAGYILVHKVQEIAADVGTDDAAAAAAATATTASGGSERVHGMTIRKVWEYEMGDMTWLRWHHAANVLIGGSENGEVYVWRIPTGECKILPGEGSRCEAGELTHDGKKLFTSYENCTLKLWDLKTCSVLLEVNDQHPMAHQAPVLTVACDQQSPLFMSGSTEGKILFTSTNGPVGSVDANGHVECVAFSPSSEFKMAASGTLFGEIAIWDYTKYTLRAHCEHEMNDGASNLKWLNNYTLMATTLMGYVYIYDARSGTKKATLSGHKQDIYDVRFSARNNILLTASEDGTAKLFKIPELCE